jgi:membrane peptidoglycan carboxypeptidase
VLVLEDRRFFGHSGVDYFALLREVARVLTLRKHGGASTIDMQLVRTATGYRAPTLKRKLYEMLLARIIQYRYSKLLILRSYLASAYLGWDLRGTEDAAQAVFGKFADELNVDEAAALASMLVFPRPRQNSSIWQNKISRRANYIKAVYVRRKKRFEKLEGRVFR